MVSDDVEKLAVAGAGDGNEVGLRVAGAGLPGFAAVIRCNDRARVSDGPQMLSIARTENSVKRIEGAA